MSEAPELQPQELIGYLNLTFGGGQSHRSNLLAVFGRGQNTRLETSAGTFEVVAVDSELRLRQALPPISDERPKMLFLVPWNQLPLDISGRFAGRGRVQTLGQERRLQSLLGLDPLASIDPSIWDGSLARYLIVTAPKEMSKLPVSGGRLTKKRLIHGWLERKWGYHGELSVPELLVWAASDGRGPSFCKEMEQPVAKGLRMELIDYIRRHENVGGVGAVLWSTWELGPEAGKKLFAFAILAEATANLEQAKSWIRLVWRQIPCREQIPEPEMDSAISSLAQAVTFAMKLLPREHSLDQEILRIAEQLAEQFKTERVESFVQQSHRLPLAWQLRLDALGDALTTAIENPTSKALAEVAKASQALFNHDLAQHKPLQYERAQMAARPPANSSPKSSTRPRTSACWYCSWTVWRGHRQSSCSSRWAKLRGSGGHWPASSAATNRETASISLCSPNSQPSPTSAARRFSQANRRNPGELSEPPTTPNAGRNTPK